MDPPQSSKTAVSEGLDPFQEHQFKIPVKEINEGHQVSTFLSSKAYKQIMTFLFQLNGAMYPRLMRASGLPDTVQTWQTDAGDVLYPDTVQRLRDMIKKLESYIEEAPPDPGPRRFGNVSFRTWHAILETRLPGLLAEHLPDSILSFNHRTADGVMVEDELSPYLLQSFGSPERLDYGTGHELNYLAFLRCIWLIGGFEKREEGEQERAIVLGLFQPYLDLIRRLIKTYTLEPAGSHGVWGLDDHSFLPYVFGSAQLCPPITSLDQLPAEGSLSGAPKPTDISQSKLVEQERGRNMYFDAIGFINDVKKGPFWEHSPMLFDISGVKAGWAKINKGMIKMYNAEVLSKYPVVQHFPFGSLLSWERDPDGQAPLETIHTSSQPIRTSAKQNATPVIEEVSKAPWAIAKGSLKTGAIGQAGLPIVPEVAVRSKASRETSEFAPIRDGWVANRRSPSQGGTKLPMTRAPWASAPAPPSSTSRSVPSSRARQHEPHINSAGDDATLGFAPTRAPWAKESSGELKNNIPRDK